MKNVMDFPFAGEHESDGQWRNDLLDLEGGRDSCGPVSSMDGTF